MGSVDVGGVARGVGKFDRGRCSPRVVGSRPSVRPGGGWTFAQLCVFQKGDGARPSVRLAFPRCLLSDLEYAYIYLAVLLSACLSV